MNIELLETLEIYKDLEDKRVTDFLYKHNKFLRDINKVDLDAATPFELAKVEYLYYKAKLYADLIASQYKANQIVSESKEDQEFANGYEKIRDDQVNKRTSADAAIMARKFRGLQMEKTAPEAANYLRWSGISKSYELAIFAIKDMIKAITKEGGS